MADVDAAMAEVDQPELPSAPSVQWMRKWAKATPRAPDAAAAEPPPKTRQTLPSDRLHKWVNIKELSEIVEAMDESEKGKAEPSATTPPPKSKAKQTAETAETPQAKLRPKRLSQQTTETPAPKRPRKTQDSAPQERAATLAAGPSILKTPERSKKKEQVWTINGSTADEEILAEMEKELGFKPFVPAAAASSIPEPAAEPSQPAAGAEPSQPAAGAASSSRLPASQVEVAASQVEVAASQVEVAPTSSKRQPARTDLQVEQAGVTGPFVCSRCWSVVCPQGPREESGRVALPIVQLQGRPAERSSWRRVAATRVEESLPPRESQILARNAHGQTAQGGDGDDLVPARNGF